MRSSVGRNHALAALCIVLLLTACGSGAATSTPEPLPARPTTPSRCGDGICDDAERADPGLCPQDCAVTETSMPTAVPPTPMPATPEPPTSEPQATKPPGKCGDGICDETERANPDLCPQDCGQPPTSSTPTQPDVARPSEGPTTALRPNIVFILTDDLDYTGIPYMPQLQALLTEQGTTFTNFFISMPLCCPSRATILRGQYGHNTQIMGNELPYGGFPKFAKLNEEESTIATWLKDVGYQTMLAGKYLNAFPDSDDPMHIPLGWTDWFSPMEGRAYEQFNYTLNENGKAVVYEDEPDDYGTDVYAAKTLDFIERSAGEGLPFFAYVAVYAPHYPTTPAPRHADLFPDATAPRLPNYDEADVSDKPAYIRGLPRLSESDQKRIDDEWRLRLQSMLAVDEMIGAIVDTLKMLDQLENTYLFFTSDNGYHLGNHRQLLGKGSPYEEEVRVTMIVRGPGVPAGKTLDHLIGNTDLAPTWAEIAGADVPEFVDGRSMVSLLGADAPSTSSWRQSYLLEHAPYDSPSGARETPTNTPPELLEPPDPDQENGGRAQVSSPTGAQVPPYRAIRTTRYSYIEYPTGERELYDLQEDPYQMENIVDSASPDLVDELAVRVKELQQCSGEDCYRVEDKPIVN